ncbi:MAG: Methionine--tRNA ligase [Phycisphaerae bacterium]|nr:Methionine--tRNA ligase [Phycisphaerae bacterium]
MSKKRYLVTGALPYSNGRLHVGHIAGAYLPADIYVRFLRACGHDVLFICGSDDNGVAALKTAREENLPVEELTAKYNESQRRAFEGLGIHFDVYGGTHQPRYTSTHEQLSQDFFRKIHDQGLFVKKRTSQLYDEQAGQFLPDRFVKGHCHHCGSANAYGDQCESCGQAIDPLLLVNPISTLTGTRPQPRDTVHWYMQLGRLQGRLQQWLESKRNNWRTGVINFALGQIEVGLPERAMTRDLHWGVSVPLDDPDAAGKVLYVWFDAPIGYVSFTAQLLQDRGGSPVDYAHYWKDPDCRIVHFIGEDNTIFHAITWPAMLLATHDSDSIQGLKGEYQLPHEVVANNFLNIKFSGKEEEKISKSRGTAIWIEDYLQQFDPDPLRYYLTAIAPESARTAYDPDDFYHRNNSELLATLGNFYNRTLTFAARYLDNKVPEASQQQALEDQQLNHCRSAPQQIAAELERCRFKSALALVMELARSGNVYFDARQPWKSRKDNLVDCATTINICLQTCRTLTTLMTPFLPFSAEKCAQMLQLPADYSRWSSANDWLPPGHLLGVAEILYRKLEPPAET